MDIGRALNFPFQDPNWIKKVAIGGVMMLLFFIIIGPVIAAGYFVRVIQRVHSGIDTPLPEWDDFGGDLARGIKLAIAVIIWSAPAWILSACSNFPGIFADDPGGGIATGAAGAGAGLLLGCLSFIASIAVAFVMPLIVTRVALSEDIGAAFQVNEIIAEAQKYAKELLILVVVQYAISFVAGFGMIICFIGVFFTSFLGYLMIVHLFAQLRQQIGGSTQTSASQPTM